MSLLESAIVSHEPNQSFELLLKGITTKATIQENRVRAKYYVGGVAINNITTLKEVSDGVLKYNNISLINSNRNINCLLLENQKLHLNEDLSLNTLFLNEMCSKYKYTLWSY